jgi:hypothetical protein
MVYGHRATIVSSVTIIANVIPSILQGFAALA